MSHDEPPQNIEYGNLKSYAIGFLSSVLLVLIPYFLVVKQVLSGLALNLIVVFLALIQATIQLFLFFNLAREPKPRWNVTVFLFMVLIVVIVVIGSLWIMNHLNYNLMTRTP